MKTINIQEEIKKYGFEDEFKKTENIYNLYFKLTGLDCKDKRILERDFDNVSIKDFCEIVNNMGFKVEINNMAISNFEVLEKIKKEINELPYYDHIEGYPTNNMKFFRLLKEEDVLDIINKYLKEI